MGDMCHVTFRYLISCIFWRFGSKLPVHTHFRGFGDIIFPNDIAYHSNPEKEPPCAETRRWSHKACKSVQRFDLGACRRKKDRTGHDSQKSYKCDMFHLLGEKPPPNRFAPKFAQ